MRLYDAALGEAVTALAAVDGALRRVWPEWSAALIAAIDAATEARLVLERALIGRSAAVMNSAYGAPDFPGQFIMH